MSYPLLHSKLLSGTAAGTESHSSYVISHLVSTKVHTCIANLVLINTLYTNTPQYLVQRTRPHFGNVPHTSLLTGTREGWALGGCVTCIFGAFVVTYVKIEMLYVKPRPIVTLRFHVHDTRLSPNQQNQCLLPDREVERSPSHYQPLLQLLAPLQVPTAME